jgi:hypothetical protein
MSERLASMARAVVQRPSPRGAGAASAGALVHRLALPPRLVVAAALLAIALGAALSEVLPGRSSPPVAAYSHGVARLGLSSLPLSTQGPVSRALGDSPAYRARSFAGGFTAELPAQHLGVGFTPSGVSVSSGATHLELRLLSIGYGSSLARLGSAAPQARANRVLYARRGLDEWYVSGPLGLEQGFTVQRAPAGRAAEPLTLALALSGNAHASLSLDRSTITLSHPGSPSLRYSRLAATDARGRALHGWLSLEGKRVLLRIDARGARYPLKIDPFVQQGPKLIGSEAKSEFGGSVALSSDGNTALVGGPRDNENKGATWVFTRSGGKWEQQGEKLHGTGECCGKGAAQGTSVALSSDGNTALIGASNDAGSEGENVFGRGAAWVFTRSAGKWTQQGERITGAGESGAGQFGDSVALSGDGNTALIGGLADNTNVGAAWVFTRSGGNWTQQGAKLSSGGDFGWSVALSEDGNTALIGSPGDSFTAGAAWVYTRSEAKWKQLGGKLTGKGEVGEGVFGISVALSADAQTALIGGRYDNLQAGAAWVFARFGENWEQQGSKLTGGGESGKGLFGNSVALSSEAHTALIGGPGDSTNIGAAWVFSNATAPTVQTQPATEVKEATAQLNATVNPNGEEVSECRFVYGPTEAYGSSATCTPSPGSVGKAVAVSAAIGSLSTNTTYHFRIVAHNSLGSTEGFDQTFTTLATSATGETKEESKPAKATDAGLSVEASGGTGKVTIGPYGSHIGGPPLLGGKGTYFQVYRSTGSSFQKIEYKDCELGGAKAIWWYNPESGWEPIPEPVAVYTESPGPCITVTATESTKPSVAQLNDPRHRGGPGGAEEYGKCELVKRGFYSEGACLTGAEKNGKPKGKYEWFSEKVTCFPQKNGRFADPGCTTPREKKGKPKGKYEQASNAFTVSGGPLKLEIHGAAPLECQGSSAEGQLRSGHDGTETITFSGCKRQGVPCESPKAPAGTIRTVPLETYTYEEEEKATKQRHFFSVFGGKAITSELQIQPPIMSFTCGSSQLTVTGAVAGEIGGGVNAMGARSTATFGPGLGAQELQVSEGSQAGVEAQLTETATTTSAQASELRRR